MSNKLAFIFFCLPHSIITHLLTLKIHNFVNRKMVWLILFIFDWYEFIRWCCFPYTKCRKGNSNFFFINFIYLFAIPFILLTSCFLYDERDLKIIFKVHLITQIMSLSHRCCHLFVTLLISSKLFKNTGPFDYFLLYL